MLHNSLYKNISRDKKYLYYNAAPKYDIHFKRMYSFWCAHQRVFIIKALKQNKKHSPSHYHRQKQRKQSLQSVRQQLFHLISHSDFLCLVYTKEWNLFPDSAYFNLRVCCFAKPCAVTQHAFTAHNEKYHAHQRPLVSGCWARLYTLLKRAFFFSSIFALTLVSDNHHTKQRPSVCHSDCEIHFWLFAISVGRRFR